MNEIFEIAVMAILLIVAGTPFVIAFDKAKKEMEADDNERGDE